jgi:filamentous hemagglutinin
LEIAESGGKHAGQLKQFLKQTPEQLQKTMKSFDKQIAKHQGWIKDPASKVKNFNSLRPEHQQNLIHHWQQDMVRHQELKSIAEDVLKGL